MRLAGCSVTRAAVAIALVAVSLAAAGPARAAIPAGNLLGADAGAEQGAAASNDVEVRPPAAPWVASSGFTQIAYGAGTFPSLVVSQAIGGGNALFAGGPNVATSTADQDVNVSGAAADIDAGGLTAYLTGQLGGFGSQHDDAKVSATFLAANQSVLGSLTIGPVSEVERDGQTTLLPRSASASVPPGTRTIFVRITATRVEGTYNDGYADNLSLTLSGSSGPGSPRPPPPSLPPLGATFKASRSTTIRRAARFAPTTTSTATADSGLQLTYSWDWDGNGSTDWACAGGTPLVSHTFSSPGRKAVVLVVADQFSRTAVQREAVTVPKSMVNPVSRSVASTGPVSTCERDRPGAGPCVKSFGFGIVEAVSIGRPSDCFELKTRVARSRAGLIARSFEDIFGDVYHASIRGPVKINGLEIPLGRNRSDYDSADGSIDLGRVSVKVGPLPTQETLLAKKIQPDRDGRFHLVSVKAQGKRTLAGMPIGGGVSIDLLRGRRSEVTFDVGLPNVFTFGSGDPAQGALTVLLDNRNGLRLDGARIGPIPYVRMGPIEVRKLFFTYRESAAVWEGGGTINLFPGGPALDASPPPPDQGFGLKNGAFDHAGASFEFPRPYPELFPGVGVSRIGFAIGVNPTRVTGDIGLAVGQGIVEIDGTLLAIFASPEHPYDMPAIGPIPGRRLEATQLSASGEAKLNVPVVGKIKFVDAYLLYQYPDYAEFGAGFKFSGDFEIGSFSIDGGVKGFVALSRRLFNFEGGLQACLDFKVVDACAGAGAVVSSRGIAVCALVPIPYTPVDVPAGVGYVWGASSPDFMLFSCDRGPYREASPSRARAAQGTTSFTLPDGLPAAAVRVRGQGGAPLVTLSGPRGERFTMPATGTNPATPSFAALRVPREGITQLWMRKPSGGRWTVTAEARSPTIASVATAEGLNPPKITAQVTGRGRRRTLRYRVTAQPGQRVTFVERGTRTTKLLGVARQGRGTIAFAPGDGKRERRRIVAMVERNGLLVRSVTVARYAAPGPFRAAKPRGLRVHRRGSTVLVSWGPVTGALRYGVTLRTSIGSRRFRVISRRSARFTNIDPALRGSLSVAALTSNDLFGRAATAKLPRGGGR
jgi:hypothetical protein